MATVVVSEASAKIPLTSSVVVSDVSVSVANVSPNTVVVSEASVTLPARTHRFYTVLQGQLVGIQYQTLLP